MHKLYAECQLLDHIPEPEFLKKSRVISCYLFSSEFALEQLWTNDQKNRQKEFISASSDNSIQTVIMGSVKTSVVIKTLDVGCGSTSGREITRSQLVRSQKTYVQKNVLCSALDSAPDKI